MTDLEMTRLCADAMDLLREVKQEGKVNPVFLGSMLNPPAWYAEFDGRMYDPLHDDAQAMALVKKFRIGINAFNPEYQVWIQGGNITPAESGASCTFNADLNRAIVECVAKMQAVRRPLDTSK